ncbi:MAG: DUF6434 domain-containing protein [Pseudomonadota bacterium]
MTEDLRPPIDLEMSLAEFERWYWPVAALKSFCDGLNLSKAGRKADLRARVSQALGGREVEPSKSRKPIAPGEVDWKRADLSAETLITDSITFGPNVRAFFKSQIGARFVCHSDFMDWVKANAGLTLRDAVEAWKLLEERHQDPAFRREIAECNNYLQYLRDIRDANPALSLEDAKRCWDQKKVRPARGGIVVYEGSDLRFLAAARDQAEFAL